MLTFLLGASQIFTLEVVAFERLRIKTLNKEGPSSPKYIWRKKTYDEKNRFVINILEFSEQIS